MCEKVTVRAWVLELKNYLGADITDSEVVATAKAKAEPVPLRLYHCKADKFGGRGSAVVSRSDVPGILCRWRDSRLTHLCRSGISLEMLCGGCLLEAPSLLRAKTLLDLSAYVLYSWSISNGRIS